MYFIKLTVYKIRTQDRCEWICLPTYQRSFEMDSGDTLVFVDNSLVSLTYMTCQVTHIQDSRR